MRGVLLLLDGEARFSYLAWMAWRCDSLLDVVVVDVVVVDVVVVGVEKGGPERGVCTREEGCEGVRWCWYC